MMKNHNIISITCFALICFAGVTNASAKTNLQISSDAQAVNALPPKIEDKGVVLAKAAADLVDANLNESKFIAGVYDKAFGINLGQQINANIANNKTTAKKTKSRRRNRSHTIAVTSLAIQNFLKSKAQKIEPYPDPRDYKPGEIIVQNLKRGTRIAIIANELDPWHIRPLIIYSNGKKVIKDNSLEDYKVISHYRYGID